MENNSSILRKIVVVLLILVFFILQCSVFNSLALGGSYAGNPITYAGGVHSMEDLLLLKKLGQNRMNVTIGSALDLFGGSMKWEDVLSVCSAS